MTHSSAGSRWEQPTTDELIDEGIDTLLDPDSDGYEAVEWVVESPEVMEVLKQMLGAFYRLPNDPKNMTLEQSIRLAEMAHDFIHKSEDHLRVIVERQL